MTQKDDDDLEQLFRHMRGDAPEPSNALLARVMHDALDAQPSPEALPLAPVRPAVQSAPDTPFWRQLIDQLGGWPALAGLASVACLGVWIGVSPPAELSTNLAALIGSTELTELLAPGTGFDFTQFEG